MMTRRKMKKMKLLSKVSCPSFDHHYCNYAVYTIGPIEKLYLLHRKALLAKVTDEVNDVYQLTFWGPFAKFYDHLDLSEFLTEAQQAELEAEGYVQIPEEFTPKIGTSLLEYELLVVTSEGFFCTAQSLQMDVTVETSGISFSELDKIEE